VLGLYDRSAIVVALMVLAVLLSCRGSNQAYVPTGQDAEQIRQVAVAYMRFISSHRNRPPSSERVFRKFLEGALKWDEAKIESMLVSPRDGQPYKIVYDVPILGSKPVVVVYERTGVGGDRYVGFDFGGVEIADEERFAMLVEETEEP